MPCTGCQNLRFAPALAPVMAGVIFKVATIRVLIAFIVLLLSACSFVDVQDYVHEPTNKLRHSIVYSSHTEIEGMDEEVLKLIPNFRTFSPSFSRKRGVMIFASKEKLTLTVLQAKITNVETGVSDELTINSDVLIGKSVPDSPYYLGFLVVVDENFKKSDQYNGAGSLKLAITYVDASGNIINETFVLKLITRKEVAWVT
jgi:hypothetical protein